MKQIILITLVVCLMPLLALAQHNTLTKKEKKEGWMLLFDGKTFNGWRTLGDQEMDPDAGWSIDNGCLKAQWRKSNNKNIMSVPEYTDFELYIEWKLAPRSNSGIMYHYGDDFTEASSGVGPEYQLIDDLDYPQVELKPSQLTGVDYGMCLTKPNKILKPIGEFNATRIVFHRGHVEHWLNGEKILEFQAWTPEWYAKAKESWGGSNRYGENKSGAFVLQNYPDSQVWFRNIKVRLLK